MPRYSQELKNSTLRKMMPPTNRPISELSRETGVPEGTLHAWRKQARSNGYATPGDGREAEIWSSQDKFHIVIETAGLSEIELADYCRSKGLFIEQVRSWRNACMQANGNLAQETGKIQLELKQEKSRSLQLEKELRRKDSALAETAALLVLRKKAHVIWGDGEDA